jgi:hypothetical protein
MKTLITAAIIMATALMGCGTAQVARDSTKKTVDSLCPTPKSGGESFMAGLIDRYMVDRQATEISERDRADIELFKAVCNTPVSRRSDYDYGQLAGGGLDRAMNMISPFAGRDFFKLSNALGILR